MEGRTGGEVEWRSEGWGVRDGEEEVMGGGKEVRGEG